MKADVVKLKAKVCSVAEHNRFIQELNNFNGEVFHCCHLDINGNIEG
jgi:hypothetical protein